MRLNVYSQELITEGDPEPDGGVVDVVAKISDTGALYGAVRLFLHSSERLHHPPEDDDRSAITFWLPRSPERREFVARTFEEMAKAVRATPPELGRD